jgi:hypothetical protein
MAATKPPAAYGNDVDYSAWREAFDAALHEYERSSGEVWRY